MTNNDVNKVKRKGTFKSAPLPEKVLSGEPLKGEELVKVAVAALEDVKGQDILVIDVREKQSITDFMIIATGTSNRQIGAMLDKVREAVKALGIKPLGEEGKGDSDWVLLDMDDVIVHMMTASARQFYDLERLWQGAEQSRSASAAHHSPENTHEHFIKLNKDQE
ncbi:MULTISPECIES: ribosome silencing factor [Pseudomonas]|jgi:ribosome-associated protein|uniref:Ribosomal silencing factor RsfS n=1 Tax=Pseudomonas gingeri TaxID=117681 RepID=A0A7Y7XD49_9PSED|nr:MULTISPECIES: ribosome silencing factor [Pseudomonas]MBV6752894.1 ribosome silencing factor [Pseudomonas chlororaphis]MCU1737047.1 ribosome silencing factor [Pseudomonas sp. 20S_6.2_Bac1]NWA26609.1 ribosome silencing factor [Pseudomonas gingeri]NWB51059.1 ribosome silencing factor [Pseudomonas gingeri]NWB97694.1 ribosome silencing factor [Pseudomonas gingeri]